MTWNVWNVTAICILMVMLWSGYWLFAEESPSRYADRLDNELRDVESRLSDVKLFAEHDPAGIMYVIRGERDVVLCRMVLDSFRRGHVDRKHVEQLFRQLRRDMAEFPPVGVQ